MSGAASASMATMTAMVLTLIGLRFSRRCLTREPRTTASEARLAANSMRSRRMCLCAIATAGCVGTDRTRRFGKRSASIDIENEDVGTASFGFLSAFFRDAVAPRAPRHVLHFAAPGRASASARSRAHRRGRPPSSAAPAGSLRPIRAAAATSLAQLGGDGGRREAEGEQLRQVAAHRPAHRLSPQPPPLPIGAHGCERRCRRPRPPARPPPRPPARRRDRRRRARAPSATAPPRSARASSCRRRLSPRSPPALPRPSAVRRVQLHACASCVPVTRTSGRSTRPGP